MYWLRRGRSRARSALIEVVTTVGLAVAIFLPVTTFGAQTVYVEQHSMIDTLQPGQQMLVDKLTPRFDPYSRGDIIVFHVDGDADTVPLIKRVIGLGGEHVAIRSGSVWIDGRRLAEPYTYADRATGLNEPTEPTTDVWQWDVPEHHLFVLGDHRQGSTDSRMRSVDMVDIDDVVGRVVFRYFPLSELGPLWTPEYPELR
jgi:signal peptidase I